MEKKHRNQNVIQKINNDFKLKLLVCVVLCFIIIAASLITNNIIEEKRMREYTIVNDIKFMNCIENITVESNKILIEGYAFMLERNSSDNSISVFLKNVVTEDEIWLDMQQVDRPDVDSYFEDKYDYKNSGFIASTKGKALDMDESYEIIINIDYVQANDNNKKTRKTVSTNRFISDSKLYTYNPVEFDKPDMNIESKLLREVFANGSLCFYQKDIGMYVYQYNGQLYWVANEKFDFEDDGLTYIAYQLYTSQVNKLPENRIQHSFDNLDFYFEENEYTDEKTAPYRVNIKDIPDDYPITSIYTGTYDTVNSKWLWKGRFHLNQNFK